MGFISRRILPVCGNMCVCCPAFRSRSRQPVKRYKKLLAEIFPKSLEGAPNERKIVKLCEYAAKNPFRIPKIAKYLEQRCSKELRSEHIKYISIITEAYHKLLCRCKEQMAYFSLSLLNVVVELLDYSKQDSVRILGCKTLTRFIHSQDLHMRKMISGGCEKNGLYCLNSSCPTSSAAAAAAIGDVTSFQWHCRLGHLSLFRLQLLFLSFKSAHRLECEACELEKHHCASFPSRSVSRSPSLFSLVYSRVGKRFGFRYFMIFVDDHSRITWLYMLKDKSEFTCI
ncbi:protein SEMI-ROLLED LEAF 2-like isoform X2 [Macadamia integrifolia]|uniref:protein SEMI-ROLLED LEAF 2-like isoform X2 n=1 Tax=Macadamia integrifolia TaxID=60698 RepID=UPI001C4E9BCE|nr:protein SEMI-ROLLED LEAF 2-like isoform X2 [Macadamia integrifolia]